MNAFDVLLLAIAGNVVAAGLSMVGFVRHIREQRRLMQLRGMIEAALLATLLGNTDEAKRLLAAIQAGQGGPHG